MFKRLAKSRLAAFGLLDFRFAGFRLARFRGFRPPQRFTLRGAGFFIDSYANDNLPGVRRPKGRRRIPSPALACHWSLIDGGTRLACHWQAESPTQTARENPDSRPRRNPATIGSRLDVAPGQQKLALGDHPSSAALDFT
jgi:hypothetical protein